MLHQKILNCQAIKHLYQNLKLVPMKVLVILTKLLIRDAAEEIKKEDKTENKKKSLLKKKKQKMVTNKNVEEEIADQILLVKAQSLKILLIPKQNNLLFNH